MIGWLWPVACRPAPLEAGPDDGRVVVALHGLGQRPQDAARLVEACDLPVRVLAPAAPTRYRDGGTWFDVTFHEDGVRFEPTEVLAAANELATWLERAAPTDTVVVGYSQGGVLALALAVTAPDRVSLAVPIAGELVDGLPLPARGPAVRAVHGGADRIVPVGRGDQAVQRLAAAGWDATLSVDPGADHAVSPAMQQAVCAALGEP